MAHTQVETRVPGEIHLSGDLTMGQARAVNHRVQSLLAERGACDTEYAKNWRLDFSAVTHSDSATLALLLAWVRQAGRLGCQVQFHGLSAQLLAVAEISGVRDLLPVH